MNKFASRVRLAFKIRPESAKNSVLTQLSRAYSRATRLGIGLARARSIPTTSAVSDSGSARHAMAAKRISLARTGIFIRRRDSVVTNGQRIRWFTSKRTEQICQKPGFSGQSFDRSHRQYGRMQVSQAMKLDHP